MLFPEISEAQMLTLLGCELVALGITFKHLCPSRDSTVPRHHHVIVWTTPNELARQIADAEGVDGPVMPIGNGLLR